MFGARIKIMWEEQLVDLLIQNFDKQTMRSGRNTVLSYKKLRI